MRLPESQHQLIDPTPQLYILKPPYALQLKAVALNPCQALHP